MPRISKTRDNQATTPLGDEDDGGQQDGQDGEQPLLCKNAVRAWTRATGAPILARRKKTSGIIRYTPNGSRTRAACLEGKHDNRFTIGVLNLHLIKYPCTGAVCSAANFAQHSPTTVVHRHQRSGRASLIMRPTKLRYYARLSSIQKFCQ